MPCNVAGQQYFGGPATFTDRPATLADGDGQENGPKRDRDRHEMPGQAGHDGEGKEDGQKHDIDRKVMWYYDVFCKFAA